MECSVHRWENRPEESSWKTARYQCSDCGTWGFRMFSKQRRGAAIEVYRNGYTPSASSPTAMPVNPEMRKAPESSTEEVDRWIEPARQR